jgi:hypothetical protein
MKRPVRQEDGMYHINGNKYKFLLGSRIQVHNKTAYKTEGGLTRDKLMMNKWGRIVSLAKHRTAKKEKRLERAGYFAQKGKFGYVKKDVTKRKRGTKKRRGGALSIADTAAPVMGGGIAETAATFSSTPPTPASTLPK